jgi:hypothetical protein
MPGRKTDVVCERSELSSSTPAKAIFLLAGESNAQRRGPTPKQLEERGTLKVFISPVQIPSNGKMHNLRRDGAQV